ncbi:MAG: transcription-repair coupling factor [Bacilli bacterium]|nr:transcription-repair coupling factor [Bacilli bacterium]
MDDTVGAALLIASLYKSKKDKYSIVATNLYSAQKIYEFLLNFISEEKLIFFPADELLRAEALSSSKELMAQRLYSMGQATELNDGILITHPSAVMRFLPNKEEFSKHIYKFQIGKHYNLTDLRNALVEMGYRRVNKIDQTLQFASRGDILDIFSVNYPKPIRIEFFDDEIEDIKFFDVSTQTSTEHIKEVTIFPASDAFLSDGEIEEFKVKIKELLEYDQKHLPASSFETLKANVENDVQDIIDRAYKPHLYKYMGYATSGTSNIFSYFKSSLTYVTDKETFEESCESLFGEARMYYSELHEALRIPTHLEEYIPIERAMPSKGVRFGSKFAKSAEDFNLQVRHIISAGVGIAAMIPTVQSYMKENDKVIIALDQAQQRQALKSFLDEAEIKYEETKGFDMPEGQLGISSASLNEGFEIPSIGLAVLSASELYGKKVANTRFSSRFKDAAILKSYDDLRPGDYVVHEYNGIGQFIEVTTLLVDGIHRDYLKIAYAKNETLYVPLEQFRLVRKYSAREGAAPRLSHLYSGEWEKKKAHIKERVNDLADRLLTLYGTRAKKEGFAYPPDDVFQKDFEMQFPYTLTADQEKSVREIKEDMEKPEIMDRLLCGDVGFGKTEIAFRAIFKAISAHKQVALLCPTTLLARQHYEVALQRFAKFGIRIAHLSRLVPPSMQKEYISAIENGNVDLVIGTHRLLSKEIIFKDLGLLVVDEEQRFGVEQKERIKEMKNTVDVLSLSATPIPRTLQMSLVGIRPLSQINTPPSNRMPIQTYVTPYKEQVVFELIQRELGRHGQVFYVYNKVASIYAKANEIARALPYARIGVVHGKMEKDEIEDVMQKYYDNEIDVLVCTSIVENGIDVPNANMIIVEEADHFGLSQLYQIKGRVGRGDRIAYAYLTYKAHKDMREDAVKRLKAIQEFTELGSGYKIAQRDLMIRGAGDMLGPEQAGFIDSIGLDLYLKMLNEAIEERKTGVTSVPPKAKSVFAIDAYIPKEYAINSDKIELYQELENAKSEEELDEIAKRMRDVYGKLPDQVNLLVLKKKIDLLSEKEEYSRVDESEGYVDVYMSDSFSAINGIGIDLFDMLAPYLGFLKVNFVEKKVHIRMSKREGWIHDIYHLLDVIDRLYFRRKS